VIFDFDGVMVDSETIFYAANCHVVQKLAEEYKMEGVKYTMEMKHEQMGRKLTDAVDCILKRTGLASKGVDSQV
jgi:beta-phosphoglucomutase-like phosphatase (HAD superfamily)